MFYAYSWMQFSASLLYWARSLVREVRGMKKGVILSSKLPYLY